MTFGERTDIALTSRTQSSVETREGGITVTTLRPEDVRLIVREELRSMLLRLVDDVGSDEDDVPAVIAHK